MSPRPEVRYARTDDGLDIAYSIGGSGPADVVVIHGFTTHLDLIWDSPWHAAWDRHLREHFRVITFDKRGTGLSERSLGYGSIEDRTRDLVAVMNAAGSARASLVGISEGAPISLVMAAAHRDRVERLVIYGGFACVAQGPDFPEGVPEDVQAGFEQLIVDSWGTGEIFGRFLIDSPDEAIEVLAQLERNSCTPQMAGKIMRANYGIDVRPLLASVAAPTLVIQTSGDPVVQPAWARVVAHQVSGARYLEFDGDFHCTSYLDRATPLIEAAVEFLRGDNVRPTTISPTRVLASVLYTDIVGSTDRAVELGDRAWTAILAQHDSIATHAVSNLGGRLVKQTGDGILALFDGPSRGIECARAIHDGLRPLGLEIRAAVHTGEIELRGDDVGGVGVHLCARVMAAAGDGETWVTRTVRDLTAGSALEFHDRGLHSLKGLPDDWQLYSVDALVGHPRRT
jgi:class 3 adenylate cyclase/alpha-beta hydrolase superfamily lysophospholipase